MESADASSSDYILIQTVAPLSAAQRSELGGLGVTILEYVPENTYICRYPPADLDAIRALPYVHWANVYMPQFKVEPSLLGIPTPTANVGLEMVAAAQPASPADTPEQVEVVFHEGVDPESVRVPIATAAGVSPESLPMDSDKVRLVVPPSRLTALAAIDEVRHIEEAPVYQLHNDVAREILGIDASPAPAVTLTGAGEIVCVADTGFDRGSTANVHPAFSGRVRRLYALGRPGNANDPDGHGTHVAGSVLGDGASPTLGNVRGTAPAAELVLQSVIDAFGGLGGLPNDLTSLLDPPYTTDGARVHTNSWGVPAPSFSGRYIANCREIDDFVWQNRDCVVCFSAGNEGQDRDGDGQVNPMSVTPPGTAKNCITIGASENDRPNFADTYGGWWPADFPAFPIANDPMANNPDGMVAFSSRGPTRDQRTKPDVVAPGSFILSTRGRVATAPPWAPSTDPLYVYLGGTSMAAPLVAGCAALVREHLTTQRGTARPSAALVKALLINGAENINGQFVPSEAGNIPNHAEGFGRVNVAASVAPPPGEVVNVQDEATALDTGDEETIAVTIPPNGNLLKVTLVWTDPAGDALQNDLDLIVRAADGSERHGNAPQGATEFDRVNNVEQVVWRDILPGQAEIIVRAHRITLNPQSYALVWRVR